MLITVVLIGVTSILISTTDVLFISSTSNETERVEHETTRQLMSMFEGGLVLALFMYIAALVVTFVVRTKTKLVGVALIVIGVLAVAATYLWGIVPFGLLLPAGILAIRLKQQQLPSDYSFGR